MRCRLGILNNAFLSECALREKGGRGGGKRKREMQMCKILFNCSILGHDFLSSLSEDTSHSKL